MFFFLVDKERKLDLTLIDKALQYQQDNNYTAHVLDKRRRDLVQHFETVCNNLIMIHITNYLIYRTVYQSNPISMNL
jgi:hypothetical protein